MATEPPSRPSLSSNVRWTLLGSVSLAAANWLLVVILARSSGPAAVGSYAFALALTAPVMSFAALQMRTLLASDASRRYAFPEYRRVTSLATAAAVLACLLLALLTGDGGGGWPVLLAVCAMRAADEFLDLYLALWQRQEEMRTIGMARGFQALVSVAAAAAAALLGTGATGTAVSGALGSFAALAFLYTATSRSRDLRAVAAPGPRPTSWAGPRKLAFEGLPLGFIMLLSVLQANVPRYFIDRSAGKAALGLFAAASQLTTAGNMFIAALGSAALPRLAAWYAEGNASFYALVRKLLLVGAALGMAGVVLSVVAGRQILGLLYRPEFAAGAPTLVVLSVAAGFWFMASFLGHALTAARIIKVQPLILICTLAVLVLGCGTLVPRYGNVGAAWAVTAGSAVHAMAGYVVLRRSRKAPKPALG